MTEAAALRTISRRPSSMMSSDSRFVSFVTSLIGINVPSSPRGSKIYKGKSSSMNSEVNVFLWTISWGFVVGCDSSFINLASTGAESLFAWPFYFVCIWGGAKGWTLVSISGGLCLIGEALMASRTLICRSYLSFCSLMLSKLRARDVSELWFALFCLSDYLWLIRISWFLIIYWIFSLQAELRTGVILLCFMGDFDRRGDRDRDFEPDRVGDRDRECGAGETAFPGIFELCLLVDFRCGEALLSLARGSSATGSASGEAGAFSNWLSSDSCLPRLCLFLLRRDGARLLWSSSLLDT